MCTSKCSWHSSRTCLSPSACVLRGLWHLCVLGGISAEYLSHVHGQTLGHAPQIVVKTAGLNTQTRAIGFQRRIWAGRASIFLHIVRSWPPPPPPGLWVWDCFMGSSEHIRVRGRRETICPSQPREEDPCEHEQPPVVTRLLCAGLCSQDFRATAPCALPAAASMRWFYRGACREAGTPAWGKANTSHPLSCGCQPAFCSSLWAFRKLCPSGSTHILLLDTEHA